MMRRTMKKTMSFLRTTLTMMTKRKVMAPTRRMKRTMHKHLWAAA